MTDLRGDFIAIARQPIEAANGDVVEGEDAEGHDFLKRSAVSGWRLGRSQRQSGLH